MRKELFIILIIFSIKCFALDINISGAKYFELLLSNFTLFNYDDIENLVVFG